MKSKNIIFESKRVRSTFGLNSFNPLLLEDISRYKNHGTLVGATWTRLPSGLWVLSFDGNDSVRIPYAANLAIGAGSGTRWCWLKLPAITDSQAWVVKRDAGGRDYNFYIAGVVRLPSSYNGTAAVAANTAIGVSVWACILTGISGGNTYFWLNGEPDGIQAQAAGTTTQTLDVFIGQNGIGTVYFPNGTQIALVGGTNTLVTDAFAKEFYSKTKHLFGV